MKNKIIALAVATFVGTNAFAVYDPSWERPVLTAEDMHIGHSTQAFNKVERLDMTLTKRDGQKRPTGITVKMHVRHSNKAEEKKLVISDVSFDGCGSTVYVANLPTKGKNKGLEARFSTVLTDHTTRLCDDYKPYVWEAEVREGYGWCGTMDATMSASGNPEGVITIQSL